MLIAGNWKMFKGPSETAEFCAALRDRESELEGTDVVVCPPYTSLHHAVSILAGTTIAVFAQSVHWASEGPYTGEVSAAMLSELGVTGAIVAHSERRQLFAETDETAALRVEGALDGGLSVIAWRGRPMPSSAVRSRPFASSSTRITSTVSLSPTSPSGRSAQDARQRLTRPRRPMS